MQRRTLIRLTGVGLTGALAGCSNTQDPSTEGPTDTATKTAEATATSTRGGDATPGADQLGAANDLQSSATVRAAVLDEDQGAGRFVFTPAVVWVESGATVTWEIQDAAHSVTTYHADNERPQRVPEDASAFDSGTVDAGETVQRTFETPGVHNYFCKPHEGIGMVGLVIVDGPQGGPGTTPPDDLSGSAASNLSMLLELAGVAGAGGDGPSYGWQTATFDSYWYSLYNMSTNIAMSGNGVLFPHNDQQREQFNERFPKMLAAAGEEQPPVKNPNLNMAPFTEGDPSFTERPVLAGEDGRPDASTLTWDTANSSKVVSPSSVAWTHLKGVTWAKNFEAHFDILPDSLAAEFRSMVLSTLAQIGTAATLVQGGPEGNGALTKNPDENLLLVSEFRPGDGTVVDDTSRPNDHTAMLWFLSDLVSLAQGGWFGYENPEPLIPADKIQMLADGMGKTVMNAFSPSDVVEAGSTRDLGQALGALGWYGTHAGSAELEAQAATYANGLAAEVEANLAGNGKVENGAANQAATQGAIAQGLAWASQVDGVDHTGTATDVVGYLRDALWDDDAGTYATGASASTYAISARDAGDITGGLNAAAAELGVSGVKPEFARFFDNTFNRGRLQRAQRPPSRNPDAEYSLPLPPNAGGEFGQAAVYNGEVAYDADADAWAVTDDRFYTGEALYLSNQDIWIGNWGGDFYQGRGAPGKSDSPPR